MTKRDNTLKEILDLILYENPSTQEEIAETLGISRRYVTKLLQPLVKDGTVKRAYMIDLKSYEKFTSQMHDVSGPKNSVGNALLNDLLVNMARHVHSQLETSFDAVLENDEEKANKALEMDFATNNMVEKIRTSVETIVSINYHSEFSKSVIYNEVAYDLERIGDYCGHIAKFAINEIYDIHKDILKKLKKMYKTAQKMIRLSMKAFIDGETDLKDDLMELEESIHILQSKSINLIATQMTETSFDEKERSNYFIYLFRVIKAFERIGDICVEIMDAAIEFHDNIPRPTTPRTFR
ncbi:PhoU domain-containing protein [Methanobrevibacter sp.]|uniref:phosphate signaling complex PhoU family protein n=1 Tax=Methanobrevibacter sp. TaxID=66852 RepID=UPI00388DF2B3